jgi:copper chaperone NosL
VKLTRREMLAGLLAFAGATLAGCGGSTPEGPQPPAITYGRDNCDECGMSINDPAYAAGTLTAAGPRLFDDIGDMFIYHRKHTDEVPQAWFVHDYNTKAWVRGEQATYVQSQSIHSPMGHGLAAFESAQGAQVFAGTLTGAKVLSFEDARGL